MSAIFTPLSSGPVSPASVEATVATTTSVAGPATSVTGTPVQNEDIVMSESENPVSESKSKILQNSSDSLGSANSKHANPVILNKANIKHYEDKINKLVKLYKISEELLGLGSPTLPTPVFISRQLQRYPSLPG
ncbi:uncharacterized protein BYT42DRAFT_617913 [Radiomyces spectabilis]|uniref:uncharacterized protein n=1 Tax=Radiomyces spectabilis TaxID=64574 RepID=UPI00221FDC62|nr:uncharacterized protein BYT42DRAFT_617913 [Radiomyces spectabilis]KAI8367488.1 hypothetical protein BYT42DRAFT_617913 [Radiomyces spectabilis]